MMTSTCSLELLPSRSLAFLEPASAGAAVMMAKTSTYAAASCNMRAALPHMALKTAIRLRFAFLPFMDPFGRTQLTTLVLIAAHMPVRQNADIRRVFKVLRQISLLYGQDTLSRRIPCSYC